MHQCLRTILMDFRPIFSHQSAHVCFLLVMLGFILRFDTLGISSTVRWLGLAPFAYDSLLHFFHASSWSLDHLMSYWLNWCVKHFSLLTINERLVCLGDGIKIPKEATRQPGVVAMHESSGNSAKAERFFGHHIGCIALLTGKLSKIFAVPALLEIHEGVNQLRRLSEGDHSLEKDPTVITRMLGLSLMVALKIKRPIYGVFDGLYSTGKAFILARSWKMDDGNPWIHLVVKGKKSYTAYPDQSIKKNEKIKLWKLFEKTELFTWTQHPLTFCSICYYATNLYWPPAEGMVRFVLCQQGSKRFLLMSSDLMLDPITLIQIYSLRTKLEATFNVLKNVIGGFGYRFWSLISPQLEKKKIPKKKRSQEVATALTEKQLKKLNQKLEAIERFINLAAIVVGILQYLAVHFTKQVWKLHHQTSWLRTYSSDIPSEETVKRTLQAAWIFNSKNRTFSWAKQIINDYNQKQLNRRKIFNHHTLNIE